MSVGEQQSTSRLHEDPFQLPATSISRSEVPYLVLCPSLPAHSTAAFDSPSLLVRPVDRGLTHQPDERRAYHYPAEISWVV